MRQDYSLDPDARLMGKVASGDMRAFEEIVKKYQKAVVNTAYRFTGNPAVAEELAQDVFVRVYRSAVSYRPEAKFSTWLFTIVRNVCLNYRTREGKLDQQMNNELDPRMSSSSSPEADAIQKELQKQIQQAIQSLPETLRLPFILNYFDLLSYEEIAKILEISLSAVKVRIHRARLALADKLTVTMKRDGGSI